MPLVALASSASSSITFVVLEIGLLLVGLGLLSRAAAAVGFSSVPLFLLAGLAFGEGGLVPMTLSASFVSIAAEIGAILLLFFLGLEYSANQVVREMQRHRSTALADILLNATPGALFALAMGWSWLAAIGLAGVTYVSSSGIATQVAREMGWRGKPEWNSLVSVLVLEDLVMAPYLPIVTALAGAGSLIAGLTGMGVGLLVSSVVLLIGLRERHILNRLFDANAPGALLLTAMGLALAAGGLASNFGFSSAVAAFLVGLLVTGDVAHAVRHRLAPLRDVFSAVFFVFFGLEANPREIAPVLVPAIVLALITTVSKIATVRFAVLRVNLENDGHPWRSALRGGSLMSARGEFSVVVGALVAAASFAPPEWNGFVAAYVIITATSGPLLARGFDSSKRLKKVHRD